MSTSTGATSRGFGVATIFATASSPFGHVTFNPRSRTAAKCAPRQMSVTSAPTRVSSAPRYDPMPPAPITPIRIVITIAAEEENDAPEDHRRARDGAAACERAGLSLEADPLDPRLSARRRHRVH